MRLKRPEFRRARIEIVPMIDTIFFLLVFFMIASLAMIRQDGLPVSLPRAEQGQRRLEARVTITIDQQGRTYLGRRPVSMAELAQRLRARKSQEPGVTAVINADERILWSRGIAVMDEVKKAGIARLAIAVRPTRSGLQ